MEAQDSISRAFKSIPGVFYDLIVYYGSTTLFAFAFLALSADVHTVRRMLVGLDTFEKIFLVVLLLAGFYVYGQLASALSYHIIKRPMNKLVRFINPKEAKDYFFEYSDILNEFSLLNGFEGKKRNYWTLVYFIRRVNPDIGDDLLKRYARVKLARINAFNASILFLYLFIKGVAQIFILEPPVTPILLETLFQIAIALAFVLIFGFEFYQRQCWFSDIAVKIYAAIRRELTPVSLDERAVRVD